MARDSSGNFTLPVGNPVVTGTVIEASWANPTMNEIATALTNSLDRTGKGAMLAPLKHTDGTESLPASTFNNETNSGMYRFAAGNIQWSVLGTRLLRLFNSAGWLWRADALAGAGEWWRIVAANTISVDADGDIAITGDTTFSNSVDLGDTVTYDGDDLATYITQATGALPSGGTTGQVLTKQSGANFDVDWGTPEVAGGLRKHRYWRLSLTPASGNVGLNAVEFSANGAAFVNNKRWDSGVVVDDAVNTITLSGITMSGVLTASTLLLGDPTEPGPPVVGARATVSSGGARTITIDFGVGNAEAVTGVRIGVDGANQIGTLELEYSDDNSAYTSLGTITASATQPDEDWSVPYAFVEQIVVEAVDELDNFPDPAAGAWWTYNTTVQTGSFTAVAGTYYFVDVTGAPAMTLPASPSPGDRVGASVVRAASTIGARGELLIELNGAKYVGDEPTGIGGNIKLPDQYDTPTVGSTDLPRPQKIELVYLDATYGWVPIYNELLITDGT